MSKIKNLIYDIQDAIDRGELSFRQIATKYEVPYSFVSQICAEMNEQVQDNDYFDDFDYQE